MNDEAGSDEMRIPRLFSFRANDGEAEDETAAPSAVPMDSPGICPKESFTAMFVPSGSPLLLEWDVSVKVQNRL